MCKNNLSKLFDPVDPAVFREFIRDFQIIAIFFPFGDYGFRVTLSEH